MHERDYFIILILMFMNLIVMALFTTPQTIMSLPLAFLIILILIDLLFVFGTAKKTYAYLFFGFSFAAMLGFIVNKSAPLYFLIAIINLIIIYYIHAFIDRSNLYVHMKTKAMEEADGYSEPSEDVPEDLPSHYDENLFTQLGYPTLQEMEDPKKSMVFDEYPLMEETAEESDDFPDYPVMEVPVPSKKESHKKGYVHIDSLNLPTPKPKKEPKTKARTVIYYGEPKASFAFTAIDELEQRIANQRVFSQKKPKKAPEPKLIFPKRKPIPLVRKTVTKKKGRK